MVQRCSCTCMHAWESRCIFCALLIKGLYKHARMCVCVKSILIIIFYSNNNYIDDNYRCQTVHEKCMYLLCRARIGRVVFSSSQLQVTLDSANTIIVPCKTKPLKSMILYLSPAQRCHTLLNCLKMIKTGTQM